MTQNWLEALVLKRGNSMAMEVPFFEPTQRETRSSSNEMLQSCFNYTKGRSVEKMGVSAEIGGIVLLFCFPEG